MNIEGLMIIYEHRVKDPIFEKLFECLDREERNKIWENVTGFVYEPEYIPTNEKGGKYDDNPKTR